MPSYRSLARNRDFTALWVGQTVSEIGSRMTMFVFPLITYALTGSAMLAAASEALHLLGLAGMLLPAGVIADRCDRRRVMRLASGAGVLLYASLAAAESSACSPSPTCSWSPSSPASGGLFAPAEMSAVRTVVPAGTAHRGARTRRACTSPPC